MNIRKSKEFYGGRGKLLTLEMGVGYDVPLWARGMELCLHSECGSMADRERFAKRLQDILAREFGQS